VRSTARVKEGGARVKPGGEPIEVKVHDGAAVRRAIEGSDAVLLPVSTACACPADRLSRLATNTLAALTGL
jgi:hypothetical protein